MKLLFVLIAGILLIFLAAILGMVIDDIKRRK